MLNGYYNQPNYISPFQQQTAQPVQQTFQSPTILPGMVVNDISSVGPELVQMSGKPSVFPLADGSAIFMKMWNQQGGITTIKYVPEQVAAPEKSNVDLGVVVQELMNRVNNLEAQLGIKEAK